MTAQTPRGLVEAVADAIASAWDCPEEDDDRMRVLAKAAIAAFLRALPDHAVMQAFRQPAVPGSIGNGSLHTIAAAVEAEGK